MASGAALEWIVNDRIPLDHMGPADIAFEPSAIWADAGSGARLREIAGRFPEKTAIAQSDRRLTYRQMEYLIDAVRRQIGRLLPQQVVAFICSPSIEAAVTALAAQSVAAKLVLIDDTYPMSRKSSVFAASTATVLITIAGSNVDTSFVPDQISRLEIEIDLVAPIGPRPALAPTMTADLIAYTSGSTGRPKGMLLEHRVVVTCITEYADACHINADDRLLSLGSLSWAGFKEILAAILTGATVFLVDLKETAMTEVLRIMQDERITVISFVPSFMRVLFQSAGIDHAARSLRIVDLFGEATLGSDLRLYRSVLQADCHIRCAMASTEAFTMFSWFIPPGDYPETARVPVGYILPGKMVALLDETGTQCGPDAEGAVVARSRFMSSGIWHDGEFSRGPILIDPADPAFSVFHSADIVRLDANGLASFVGRADRQIKIRGMRANPADVEGEIRTCAGVADVAVIVRHEPDEEPSFVAYVVPQGEADTTLAAAIVQTLEPHVQPHMIPSDIRLIAAIPRLPNFKPDHVALMALDRSTRAAEASLIDADFDPQRSPSVTSTIRDAVRRSWIKAFGAASYLANTPFDQVRSDSLKILQVLFNLERVLNVRLPTDLITLEMTPRDLTAGITAYLENNPARAQDDRALAVMLTRAPVAPDVFRFASAMGDWFRFHFLDAAAASAPDPAGSGALSRADLDALAPVGPISVIGYASAAGAALEIAQSLGRSGNRLGLVALLQPETPSGDDQIYYDGPVAIFEASKQIPDPGEAIAWQKACRVVERVRLPEGALLAAPNLDALVTAVADALGRRESSDEVFAS